MVIHLCHCVGTGERSHCTVAATKSIPVYVCRETLKELANTCLIVKEASSVSLLWLVAALSGDQVFPHYKRVF